MTYLELMERLNAFALAITTMSFDANTIAPLDGAQTRNKAMAYLSGEYFALITSDEAIETLKASLHDEDPIIQESSRYLIDNLQKDINMPKDEFVAFQQLKQDAQQTWEKAKAQQDYSIFEADLVQLIETHKKLLKYRNDGLNPYESSLDDYEKGLRKTHVDTFFKAVNEKITPFIDTVIEHQEEKPAFLSAFVSTSDQVKISNLIMEHLGYTKNFGLLAYAEHPFSSTLSINDSRITTHIHENDFTSNIFSIIHEIGHSMYNHQVNPAYEGHALEDNMSYSMHESQSRLLENMIGRSKEFWTPLYPKLQDIIPSVLNDVSLDTFIKGINYVEKGFIRIEADELTYPLHIMVRYDLENKIFSDNISTDHLNTLYADVMASYLGVEVLNDAQGILQDVHWSDASFGYFPTYALGTAYAAQFMHKMRQDLDVDALLIDGNLATIFTWLKENIHQYSGSIETQDMILKVSNEAFNPAYYTNYLIEKYTHLLGISLDSNGLPC